MRINLAFVPIASLVFCLLLASWANALTIHSTAGNPNSSFGNAVAIDGGRVLVGEPGDGNGVGVAHLFDSASGALIQTFRHPPAALTGNDHFGSSVSIDGDLVLIGAAGIGVPGDAHLFNATSGALLHTFSSPNPSTVDVFGASVALRNGKAVIGSAVRANFAGGAGRAYLFDAFSGQLLNTLANPAAPPAFPSIFAQDFFGGAVAMDDDFIVVGAPGDDSAGSDTGRAFVFDAAGNYLNAIDAPGLNSTSFFGVSVAVDAGKALVGASNFEGANESNGAYLFDLESGAHVRTFTNPDPAGNTFEEFGYVVAMQGDFALIGAPRKKADGTEAAGTAYLFNTANGLLINSFTDPDPAYYEMFGNAVAIDDGVIAVGVPNERSPGSNGGDVHLFSVPEPAGWVFGVQSMLSVLLVWRRFEHSFSELR
ncbi:MAG: hypothetical protein C0485_16220 [Pirellula sp.]|nr:hypothetical protein [Pirellula sp.]